MRRLVGAIVTTIAFAIAPSPAGAAEKPGKVEVALVADAPPTAPGRPLRIGLRMKMDPGWHVYWRNPGDAGMPAKIGWTLPPGWTAGDIEWPAPRRIPVGTLASYGYEGEIVLPVLIFPPRAGATLPVQVSAEANWLVCKESCLPESATLAITLDGASPAPATRALFDAARRAQPHAVHWDEAVARRRDGRLQLRLSPATPGEFFPDLEELVEPGDPPRIVRDGRGMTWSAALGTKGRQLPPGSPIRGVWVPTEGRPVLVDATLAP